MCRGVGKFAVFLPGNQVFTMEIEKTNKPADEKQF